MPRRWHWMSLNFLDFEANSNVGFSLPLIAYTTYLCLAWLQILRSAWAYAKSNLCLSPALSLLEHGKTFVVLID